MSWRDELAPGDVLEGPKWDGSGKVMGVVLTGDDEDSTILVMSPKTDTENNPEGDAWDTEWVKLVGSTDMSDSDIGRDLRAKFPISPLSPEYIFMVIRPSRKITAYANLDALIHGMFAEGERVSAERKEQIMHVAAQCIADPETDFKIAPGASNSPWVRFTQVEGA
jgi:hypothetical protein